MLSFTTLSPVAVKKAIRLNGMAKNMIYKYSWENVHEG